MRRVALATASLTQLYVPKGSVVTTIEDLIPFLTARVW